MFSNELVEIDTSIPPGSWVTLESSSGKSLGYGYFNPHSLIAYRSFERCSFQSIENTQSVFFQRLEQALALRHLHYREQIQSGEMGPHSFRLCFGESDGLNGLVIDLFEPVTAVLQCHSAGADQFIPWTQKWLLEKMAIKSGIIRNDIEVRKRENARLYVQEWGEVPKSVFCIEGGVRFFVDAKLGQKTGYFYDHRDNRAHLAKLVSHFSSVPIRVLDSFAYTGAWGLQILAKNKNAVLTCVDSSSTALDWLLQNAKENGFSSRVKVIQDDWFHGKTTTIANEKFDVVICDPPALTSSAKQKRQGMLAHVACFEKAIRILKNQGLAALSSCSFHLSWEEFLQCVQEVDSKQHANLCIECFGSQAADHPVLASMPETRYLKCVFLKSSVW